MIFYFQLLMKCPDVKTLLEEFDRNENTPLHIAAVKGHTNIVKVGRPLDKLNFL